MKTISYPLLINKLREQFSDIIAIYLFGSYYNGHARQDSDLDIAVLFKEKKNTLAIWEASTQMASTLNLSVDLIQLNTASTVFRYVILSESKLLYCSDINRKDRFEVTAISMYLHFNEARKDLLRELTKARKSQ